MIRWFPRLESDSRTMLLLLVSMTFSLNLLLIPSGLAETSEADNGFCSKEDADGHDGCSAAAGVDRLSELEESWVGVDKLVFIESSGRDHLPRRYLCAVESALRFAGVPVVVVMTSPTLDANSHNGTRLIMDLFPGRLHFRHADPIRTLKESPFGEDAEAVRFFTKMYCETCPMI